MVDRKPSVENESTTANSNNNITAIKGDTSAAAATTTATATATVSETSSLDIIELEIQDIEGIGPTTAKKLKEAGIVSVMDLAVATADELSVDINASKESARYIHNCSPKVVKRLQSLGERIRYCRCSSREKEILVKMFYRF